MTHLEDPLEGVQVADLTLHNGTQDETSHNLKHDENSAALESAEAWGASVTDCRYSRGQQLMMAPDTHTHLLTAEPLWHGAELSWGVFQLRHEHVHVSCIILLLHCKSKHTNRIDSGGRSAGGNSASIWSRLSGYTFEVESPDTLHGSRLVTVHK